MSGLGVRYDLGKGHPLLGRRMPDLDLLTPSGPLQVFTLLHAFVCVDSKPRNSDNFARLGNAASD